MVAIDFDPRIAKFPLMDSPSKTAIIVVTYFVFVTIVGPTWMKNRQPFNLRKVLIAYNFMMVAASVYMFHQFGKHAWFSKYSWRCENIKFLEDEDSMAIVNVSWWFYISKIIELLDTVFFVLRKKYSQISTLHLVHHSLVPLTSWYQISRASSGYNTIFGILNPFVHIWMYLYYGLAAFGPSVQKYLWWKKYLTTLQLIQFCIVTAAMISVCITPGCEVSYKLVGINLGQALFFFVMFLHFYLKSYIKPQKSIKDSKNKTVLLHSGHRAHQNYISDDFSGHMCTVQNKLLHDD